MKTEAEIITVENGKIKEVKMFDELYSVHPKQVMESITRKAGRPQIHKEVREYGGLKIQQNIVDEINSGNNLETTISKHYPNINNASLKKYIWAYRKYLGQIKPKGKTVEKLGFGKTITVIGHAKIYENILNDFKHAMVQKTSLKSVIRKYYAGCKKSTITAYTSVYRRYLRTYGEATPVPIKTPRKKHHRTPPTDAYGFDETYTTWILNREVDRVKNGLRTVRFGYVPTVKSIADQEDMAAQRVRAVLHLLQKDGKAGYMLTEDGQIRYFLKE
jgi:hypothetical protein